LEILLEIYKAERKIYNQTIKGVEIIESIEENHKDEEYTPEPVEDVKEPESPKSVKVLTEESSEPENTVVRSEKSSRNINIRLGVTMICIMIIYGVKKDRVKAQRFKEEAEKFILAGTEGNKQSEYYLKFLSSVGDMHMKYGKSASDLEASYSYYEKANRILENLVGNKSITFLLSMVDIAEVYTQQKKYNEAIAFLNFVKGQIITYYGEKSIFLNRVNSCLVEAYSEMGGQTSGMAYKLSMDNVDLAMSFYGENSLF
jgi:tetratricopeptide (TPR) repeat protein